MTATLLAPVEAALEAGLGAGWTVTAGPAAVLMSEGLRPVLPADIFDRPGETLIVTRSPAGRIIHATLTRHAGEEVLGRESAAGADVVEFVMSTLTR